MRVLTIQVWIMVVLDACLATVVLRQLTGNIPWRIPQELLPGNAPEGVHEKWLRQACDRAEFFGIKAAILLNGELIGL